MIKTENYSLEQLKIFYSNVYYLKYIYNLLSFNDTTFDNFKDILNLIDEYQKQFDKEYLDEISIRVKYYIEQSVFTHQKDFFTYFSQNYFFSTEEDKKEEIEQILQSKNDYLEINTFITNHSSIYNKNEMVENYVEKINFNLPLMDKFLKFEQYFLWFNDYLSLYQKTINTFLKTDSILPIQWKFYLGIMAVSTMKNELLFRILEEDFLIYGGDINWLIFGLDVVPNKIKKLAFFNDLLCHQPWKINKNEIEKLKKIMNLNEINESILILILFQKIAIIEELIDIKECQSSCNSSYNSLKSENKKRKSLIQVLDKVDDRMQEEMIIQLEQIKKEEDDNEEKEFDNENLDLNFFSYYNELEKNKDSFNSVESAKGNKENNLIEEFFKKHVSSENEKIAFSGSNNEIVLTYFEYDWDTGLFILKNLSSTFIECLNNEIEYITSITSNSLGNIKIDNLNNKKYIHQALIHYIERLFGYYHEDYNYKNITKILSGHIKLIKYIKKFVCFPKRISISDFHEINKVFLHEEIIHIIILIGLIKSKIQLIYFSKALNETMNNNETI